MTEFVLKKEIKEEIPDENYDELDTDDEEMLLKPLKLEPDEIDGYQQSFELPASSKHPIVYNINQSKTSKEDDIKYEDVYIDGEPEVPMANFKHNEQGECTPDPLAFHTATKPLKKVKIIRVPPIRDLVQKTYSKRKLNKSKTAEHVCSTCKNPFPSLIELRQHERICFKCKECNLIFQDLNVLMKHMKKKCKRKDQRKKWSRQRSDQSDSIKSCNICMTTFFDSEDLEEHRKLKHVISNAYNCHFCESKFDSEDDAYIHLKIVHMSEKK